MTGHETLAKQTTGLSIDVNPMQALTNHSGFCYIDARDCAQAFRLSLETPLKGTHVFNIANADNTFKVPTSELKEKVFPDIPWTPDTDNPREGLISIKKAREVLGYDPKYEWQKEVERMKKEGKL